MGPCPMCRRARRYTGPRGKNASPSSRVARSRHESDGCLPSFLSFLLVGAAPWKRSAVRTSFGTCARATTFPLSGRSHEGIRRGAWVLTGPRWRALAALRRSRPRAHRDAVGIPSGAYPDTGTACVGEPRAYDHLSRAENACRSNRTGMNGVDTATSLIDRPDSSSRAALSRSILVNS